jgi:TatD DNase family protein
VIIDSHAHYAHPRYEREFPYLTRTREGYALDRGDRAHLFAQMRQAGITGFIEPSIELDGIDAQLALAKDHPACLGVALGVHPTRCVRVPLHRRSELKKYISESHPVAIGETGLDFHLDRAEQHRMRQRIWFAYQLRLAEQAALPLVLHVREADEEAIRILRRHRKRLHGGVVHCFSGTLAHAQAYIDMGLTIGIGGRLLWNNADGDCLREVVRHLPLSAILIETDAPLVLPSVGRLDCPGNQQKKMRNSSLILPTVIEQIAELQGIGPELVEETVYQNTLRLFQLQIQ